MNKRSTSLLKMMTAFVLALLFSAPQIGAETTLYLRTKSAADQAVVLGQMNQVVFGDTNVTVNLTNGNDVIIPVADFTSVRINNEGTQGGTSGVMDIVADDAEGGWQVYDLQGRYVGDGGYLNGELTPGVYVVKSLNKTIKIVVK
jgi:hypothetical protein